jgi:hypothetical protein
MSSIMHRLRAKIAHDLSITSLYVIINYKTANWLPFTTAKQHSTPTALGTMTITAALIFDQAGLKPHVSPSETYLVVEYHQRWVERDRE